jgi:hypothetical protein
MRESQILHLDFLIFAIILYVYTYIYIILLEIHYLKTFSFQT